MAARNSPKVLPSTSVSPETVAEPFPSPSSQGSNLDCDEKPLLRPRELYTVSRKHYECGRYPIAPKPTCDDKLTPTSGDPRLFTTEKEAITGARTINTTEKQLVIGTSEKEAVDTATPRRLSFPLFKKQSRHFFILIAIGSVFIILAALLGGVLGSRSVREHNGVQGNHQPEPARGPAGPSSNSSRVPSAFGLRNGTGIAVIGQNQSLTGLNGSCIVLFQDFAGCIKSMRVSIPSSANENLRYEDSKPVDINAANGTGLAGITVPVDSEFEKYAIVYIDPNGTLCDVWTDSERPDGPWEEGNLSRYGFQAPLGRRPAMHMAVSTRCWGTTGSSVGVHLWAGNLNGIISQYSYDVTSGNWSSEAWPVDGTFAFAGLDAIVHECSNTTLLSTDATGRLMYLFQDSSSSHSWPLGGLPFTHLTRAPEGTGSSYPGTGIGALTLRRQPEYTSVFFVNNDTNPTAPLQPMLAYLVVNGTAGVTDLFTTVQTADTLDSAMSGTDMAIFHDPDPSNGDSALLVFQNNGTNFQLRYLFDANNTERFVGKS